MVRGIGVGLNLDGAIQSSLQDLVAYRDCAGLRVMYVLL